MPSIPDTNAQAGVHLLLHLDKIERDKKTGRPKSNQDPWFQARPLMAKALWLDQLADARLSPAAHRLGLKLALRCGGLPLGLFKASKTLAAELGVSDAGNLRTLLGKLVDAGLLCRDTYTTKTEGKEINCYLFRVALNAGALAEAQAASAYHSPAGEMVAKAKPTGAAAAGARRDERLAELELRRRSTQPPAFTVNTPPALTVNAPTAHEQPALTVNADLAASHCDSTEQVDDGRQEPALTVNAQLESQESNSSGTSLTACPALSLTFESGRHTGSLEPACGRLPSDPVCSKKNDLAGEDQFQLTWPVIDLSPALGLPPASAASGDACLAAPFSTSADSPTDFASGETAGLMRLIAEEAEKGRRQSPAPARQPTLDELLALLDESQQPAGADEEEPPTFTGKHVANDLQHPAF